MENQGVTLRAMTIDQAAGIVREAVKLGMIEQSAMMHPSSDRLKQREVWRYLQLQGLPRTILDKWVESGQVHRRKNERNGKNAMVWYSLREIQRAILAAKMADVNYDETVTI